MNKINKIILSAFPWIFLFTQRLHALDAVRYTVTCLYWVLINSHERVVESLLFNSIWHSRLVLISLFNRPSELSLRLLVVGFNVQWKFQVGDTILMTTVYFLIICLFELIILFCWKNLQNWWCAFIPFRWAALQVFQLKPCTFVRRFLRRNVHIRRGKAYRL